MPNYTTDEACRSKILYAITACGEIDADDDASYIQEAGGNYSDSD